MASYSIRADESELAALVSRVEAGEEIVLSRDGQAVARILPFPTAGEVSPVQPKVQRYGQAYGQNVSGVGLLPDSFDHSLPVDDAKPVKRRGGQNFSGLAGTDLSWIDKPLPEDIQRAFGMID